MSKPIALVIGATGAQGGSVANALLDKYTVRTLSRNADKPAAKALAAKGIEVIQGDIANAAIVREALKGAEAVFLVTQFWETFDKDREVAEGKTFVDEVAAAGVKKFVFSALENVSRVTGGKITSVAHFDGKGQLLEYIREKHIPCAAILMAAYFENFLGFFVPRPNEDGTLTLTLPDMHGRPFNGVSVAETGLFVRGIFDRFDEFVGKETPLCTDDSTLEQVAETLSRAVGKTVKFNGVPYDVFASFGFPGAKDIAGMFQFYAEGPCDRSTAASKALCPSASNLEKWASAHKAELEAAWFKSA
jgi:uncharacterized protein YbjT (DUF2867 family)